MRGEEAGRLPSLKDMKKIEINLGLEEISRRGRLKPQVATIGFFDGVHCGHRNLIEQVRMLAGNAGMESMVVTFDRHPQQVLAPCCNLKLLSTFERKLSLLSKTHIDNCAVLPFDSELASMSAREFMEKILKDRLGVCRLVIGYDNRFGCGRTDDFEDYVRYGKEIGMEVTCGEVFVRHGVRVSSSVVRSHIERGEIEQANDLLGYRYTITGKVVEGFQKGREFGFPTANVDIGGSCQIVPANGVYSVTVRTPQSMEQKRAMMNIGMRPTFGGQNLTLEVHILNFCGDIYGQTISVSFVHRIRDEHKFDSADELVRQLRKDERLVMDNLEKT